MLGMFARKFERRKCLLSTRILPTRLNVNKNKKRVEDGTVCKKEEVLTD